MTKELCVFCQNRPAKHLYESPSGPMRLCGRCNPWTAARKQKAAARVAAGLRFEPLHVPTPPALKPTTSVYFIQSIDGGPIKIGWAHWPERRLSELQPGNPEYLIIIGRIRGGSREERAIHRQFAHLRIRSEWFEAESELLEFIAEHATEDISGRAAS